MCGPSLKRKYSVGHICSYDDRLELIECRHIHVVFVCVCVGGGFETRGS